MKTCPDCNGDGVVDKDTDDERQCPTCGGVGFVPDNDDDHEEIIKTSRDLPLKKQDCQGGEACSSTAFGGPEVLRVVDSTLSRVGLFQQDRR